VGLGESVGEGESVGLGESVGEGDSVGDGDSLGVGDSVTLGVGEGVVGLGEGVCVWDGVGVGGAGGGGGRIVKNVGGGRTASGGSPATVFFEGAGTWPGLGRVVLGWGTGTKIGAGVGLCAATGSTTLGGATTRWPRASRIAASSIPMPANLGSSRSDRSLHQTSSPPSSPVEMAMTMRAPALTGLTIPRESDSVSQARYPGGP
jgi:hypothetical protein